MRRNRAWLRQNLPTLNFFTVNTTKQATNIVTSLATVQKLTEHLNTRDNRL